jgi:hypothetical protein
VVEALRDGVDKHAWGIDKIHLTFILRPVDSRILRHSATEGEPDLKAEGKSKRRMGLFF